MKWLLNRWLMRSNKFFQICIIVIRLSNIKYLSKWKYLCKKSMLCIVTWENIHMRLINMVSVLTLLIMSVKIMSLITRRFYPILQLHTEQNILLAKSLLLVKNVVVLMLESLKTKVVLNIITVWAVAIQILLS